MRQYVKLWSFIIDRSYSKSFPPSLIGSIIIKVAAETVGNLFGVWGLSDGRGHVSKGSCIRQLSGGIWDLRKSCVEISMLRASLGKGYKDSQEANPCITHNITTDQMDITSE